MEAGLRPVPYYHAAFTPPASIGGIAWQNKSIPRWRTRHRLDLFPRPAPRQSPAVGGMQIESPPRSLDLLSSRGSNLPVIANVAVYTAGNKQAGPPGPG